MLSPKPLPKEEQNMNAGGDYNPVGSVRASPPLGIGALSSHHLAAVMTLPDDRGAGEIV
jgi:hypothetical protein